MKKKVSDEQMQAIEQRFRAGASPNDLGREYGVSGTAIRSRLRLAGVSMRPKKRVSEADLAECVKRYEAGATFNELASQYGVTRAALIYRFQALGITTRARGGGGKYTHDTTAFDAASPNACYWLGFLAADGSFFAGDGHAPGLRISIAATDAAHLKHLKAFLAAGHPVEIKKRVSGYGTQPVALFSLRSAPLYRAAERFGLAYLKPRREPMGILARSRDFWRGVVDGDGSVQRSKTGGAFSLAMYAHPPMMDAWIAFLELHDVAIMTPPKPSKGGLTYHILSGSRARFILRLLYQPGDMALLRKVEVANKVPSAG